ncbi:MAG: lytic murein transglycosylase, partial [Methylococcales bacterium]
AEVIIAIIGVESMYGQKTGNFRIIDALATLGFAYPPRSRFFLSELEHFLLLCREEHLDPRQPTGSYAGAMGMPQFMPSSFRTFAADFDNDGHRDIWHNNADVIFSIANYFAKHQWLRGQPIAVPATAKNENYQQLSSKDLKPDLTIADLETLQITTSTPIPANSKVKLLAFEEENGHHLIASLNNFYVITRYNHSPLYALAVQQLSQDISNQKISSPYE